MTGARASEVTAGAPHLPTRLPVTRGPADSRPRRLVPLQVARFEARRLTLHPLLLCGTAFLLAAVVTIPDDGADNVYDVVTTGPTFFMGMFVYFAANLTASRARRHRCDEHHASFPSPPLQRTAGLCLATLGPATVAAGIVLGALVWNGVVADRLVVWPGIAELAAGPLTVVGGGLLGIMIARWLPFPMASVAVMVALVAANVWVNTKPETLQLLGPYASFSRYTEGASWAGVYPGSFEWHAVYLVALCAMAATGALLPEARRKLPVLAAGAAFTVAAVLAGLAQLP